mgnify:FL=1
MMKNDNYMYDKHVTFISDNEEEVHFYLLKICSQRYIG